MPSDEQYDLWKQSRMTSDVPDDFADRVMKSIHEYGQRSNQAYLRGLFVVVLASRIGKTAICLGAALACIVRIVHVFSIFFVQ